MFSVKICGITCPEDAQAAAEAGADAVGLNFFSGSPRYLSAQQAQAVIEALPATVLKVGLFVNAQADDVRRTCRELHLDLVQLHGDEPPDVLAQLRGVPVMRALRGSDPAAWGAYLTTCQQQRCMPRLVLVDAHEPGRYGGTGRTADWASLVAARAVLHGLPLVLAGGLTPDNVAEAVRTVRPWAVDVASGVERAPGRKCAQRMRQFVAAAREALRPSGC